MRMGRTPFSLTHDDWSLHRKGQIDQERHREKVRRAIRERLADLVTEESIVLSRGGTVFRVPIRSLEEYRFRYQWDKGPRVGQGQGGTKPGDVIGRMPGARGQGAGQAGDAPGVDYYETEVSLEELENILFESWELPNRRPKDRRDMEVDHIEFTDIRKQGMMANLDKKRTILEAMRRNAREGRGAIIDLQPDDLRFKTWDEVKKPETAAVVIAMMDTSGSMGTFEKYVARSFYFWMVRFLRRNYRKVEIAFIAHHVEAKEVSEEEFFNKGESGGTRCSSAYELALELVERRYPPASHNIYPFHFTDGDNLGSDNPRTVELAERLLEYSSAMGYAEVISHGRESRLMEEFRRIQAPHLRLSAIRDREDVYRALASFFAPSRDVS
ncbi:sporulation protein YhbH [Kyrpidia spormannii]|uniref:Sporulation protein YhbH n=2 Tax=Kyrpidia spormannii TaxID=2055160 RepID=A0A2K8N3X4_9BACL|nr:sporulation protein YhbH [Kyrpidia spormannii]ATY84171.1 sporulation protein YhbH [Kyrpidia spormannii]